MQKTKALAFGFAAVVALLALPGVSKAATMVTNGTNQIGSFPIGENISDTAWRISTGTLDNAAVTAISPGFVGSSSATLADTTGWNTVYNGDFDDDFKQISFGFNSGFNTTNYGSVFIGSNTYLTFGDGSSEYSGLAADVPPLPGVHMCSDDNSYQKVFYKSDGEGVMRVRYEGTNDTSGTNGSPNIVYEAVFYQNQPYFDLYMGINASCPQSDVYVDDDYVFDGSNDGHTWQVDAFDNISNAVNAVAENGTVHVAAGNYDGNMITIDNPGVRIVGPGIGDGVNRAIFQNTNCDVAFDVSASGVRIEGLQLEQRNGLDGDYCISYPVVRVGNSSFGVDNTSIINNSIAGGTVGVAVNYQSSISTISGNDIYENLNGIVVWTSENVISDNDIHDNYDRGISLGCGLNRCGIDVWNLGGTVVSGNVINNNPYGIYFGAGDQESSVVIGDSDLDDDVYSGNVITGNGDGININGNAYNLRINGNQIYGNSSPTSAVHVAGALTGLDVAENWWGDTDDSGPYQATYNPLATGDELYVENSNFVLFRPFCLNQDCSELSSVTVTPETILTLFENGGSITPILNAPEDCDLEAGVCVVNGLDVNEDTIITLPTGDGVTTITLPAGTVITKTAGGSFSAEDLSAGEVQLGDLTGFGLGETPMGAMQWGLPDFGLTFSQPITISMYVGTALNGQTLIIKRMPPEGGDWTDDGIVAPGTCEVTDGVCTFETTKASDFVALDGPEPVTPVVEEENEKAKITSWKASLYDSKSGSCKQKLLLVIKGKHFDDDAEVKIGSKEASSVDVKSSKKIEAKFCYDKLIDTKVSSKRKIRVTNPGADTEEADKKIDINNIIDTDNFDQNTPEGIKNIQNALVKLGYLDKQYVTGFYGPITTEAVKKFQGDNGIFQTGNVGPLTSAKLEKKLK